MSWPGNTTPRLWDRERLEALLAAGRLTQEEFDSLVTAEK
jgi:hypothetical protein